MSGIFRITRFVNHAAKTKTEHELTAVQLAEEIRQQRGPSKAALPWLKLARFGDDRSEKGSLRHDGNVIAVTGVEADYDGEQMAFDEAVERLRDVGLDAVAYTSPSYTPSKPRWRVLCPFSEEHRPIGAT